MTKWILSVACAMTLAACGSTYNDPARTSASGSGSSGSMSSSGSASSSTGGQIQGTNSGNPTSTPSPTTSQQGQRSVNVPSNQPTGTTNTGK